MKLKVYKLILIILIISAIIVSFFVIKKYTEMNKVENKAKEVVENINIEKQNNNNEIISEINQEIQGNKVVGIIKIPKIDLEYPILEKTNVETLKLSITKFWGNQINEIGNVTLAGHNNLSGTMFGKTKKLEIGDTIELTDIQNVTLKYEIFDKYVIDPNDISCILPVEENTREVTLITCTNGNKNRLIVKAREIK
ncbi:MAG: sortase [Candidatus Scatovivens sp.]